MELDSPGKMATLADFEAKLFVVVLGLGEVTDATTDVIDAPPLPKKGLGRAFGYCSRLVQAQVWSEQIV